MTDETNNNPEESIDPLTGEKIVAQLTQDQVDAKMDNGPSRRESLRQRADLLGLTYSPNIGDDTLQERIDAHIKAQEDAANPEPAAAHSALRTPLQTTQEDIALLTAKNPEPNARSMTHRSREAGMPSDEQIFAMTQDEIAALSPQMRTRVIRRKQRKEGMRMLRCQIYNNNPAKNELKGEILSVGNKYLGTVRKFIPFGEATENGYHVPKVLVDMLRSRKYQRVRSVKNADGTERVETILAPEFTINELPPLTEAQLKELAQMQQARNASVGFVGA